MKRSGYKGFSILTVLVLSSLACGLLTVPTPTPNSVPVSTLIPATQQPSPISSIPTTATVLPAPTQEASLTPATAQPSSASHFKSGDPIQLDSIVMKSRNEGWGLSGPYVLTTADGGSTWHDVTPPATFPTGTKNQAYGTFLNAQTAWIVFAGDDHISPEAAIWHTIDGGYNWTPSPPLNHQAVGDRVWAEFTVLDTQNIWALVRGVYAGAGIHHNHELFHSTNGGLTWTSLDGQTSDDYTGIVFADPKFGLRTLQTTGAYAAAPPAYEVTNDGGATWETHELPALTETPDLFNQYPYCETYQPVLLSTQAIRMLMGCFDSYYPHKQFISYFYSSQDGGTTWQTIRLPNKVQAEQDQLIYFGLNNALLLGRDNYLSTSDGQTWSFIKAVNWDGQYSFSDPQYGWAIARSNGAVALVQTINGAATWKIIKPVVAQ